MIYQKLTKEPTPYSEKNEFTILGTWYNHKGEVLQKKREVFENGTYVEYEDQANFETNHAGWKEAGKGIWKEEISENILNYRFIEDNEEYGTSYNVNSWGNLEYKDVGRNILILWTR